MLSDLAQMQLRSEAPRGRALEHPVTTLPDCAPLPAVNSPKLLPS
jgi:hypothetical protein